jgi:benzoate/toluate 1,2-dioxygenase beta subunit
MTDLATIEAFLYREASFLDRPDLDSWIELYTDDAYYWIPATEDQVDPINHVSHIYDDRVMMEIRRRNFIHPRAASKDSLTRCSHLIGNIRIIEESTEGTLIIESNQHVVVWYQDEQRLYAFTAQHALSPDNGSFKIKSKRVDLINPEAAQKSLVIYL